MKDLPKVFHNKIDKKFDNNRSVYYSSNGDGNDIVDNTQVRDSKTHQKTYWKK